MLQKASKLTGIKEKTLLVRLGLEALGGTEKNLEAISRRRLENK